MDKPLISFTISCYNQESFIREAVEGAFSQTYSPLEIIISDDCSKDRTFEIAQQMAAAYKGPHTVRLNRNEKNLGISGNANRASALCHGELIVGAAGDDISVPERTSITVQAWNDSGRKATTIFSGYVVIDESGRTVEGETQSDPQERLSWFINRETLPASFGDEGRISQDAPVQLLRSCSLCSGRCLKLSFTKTWLFVFGQFLPVAFLRSLTRRSSNTEGMAIILLSPFTKFGHKAQLYLKRFNGSDASNWKDTLKSINALPPMQNGRRNRD